MDHRSRNLKFDIAWALSMVSPNTELPFTLPEKLSVSLNAQALLDRCIDSASYTESSCRLRDDVPTGPEHTLRIGTDSVTLHPGGWVIAGGSGVTVQVYDHKLRRAFALKVPRVSVLAYVAPNYDVLEEHFYQRITTEFKKFENERQIARLLSHVNIAQHFYGHYKHIPLEGAPPQLPYSLSEWIPDAQPLHKYLVSTKDQLTFADIISLFGNGLAALAHMHEQGVIHWDLKSDNILVSGASATLKIIDFGNSKLKDVERDDDLVVTTTRGKYPELNGIFKIHDLGADESRRFRIDIPDRIWSHDVIDLWMFVQEWNRLLALTPRYLEGIGDLPESTTAAGLISSIRRNTVFRSEEIADCLRIIFERALRPLSKDSPRLSSSTPAMRLDLDAFYYTNANEISSELGRIQPRFGAGQQVPELLASLEDHVRLPVTGNSVFTTRIAAVVDSAIISATRLHYQLGQVAQAFPGAAHTRYEHLLGTLATATHFVRSLYLNDMNAFWRISVDAADVRAILLAAVLHDSGHLAMGHYVEELDDLMTGFKHEDYIRALLYRCETEAARDAGRVVRHDIERYATFEIDEGDVRSLVSILRRLWCTDNSRHEGSALDLLKLFEILIAIFQPRRDAFPELAYLSRDGTRAIVVSLIKSIIDGPLDADKLDYLRRDALHSGVFFANGIDLERFFESLRACVNTSHQQTNWLPSVGVSQKGVAPLETIVTARYHLYSAVYWHRTMRGITAALHAILSEIRLATTKEENWASFLQVFVREFRTLDDRQALSWLKDRLEKTDLLRRTLSPARPDCRTERTCLADLMDALLGVRTKYFQLGYELTYIGPFGEEGSSGMTAREQLHNKFCSAVHPRLERMQAHKQSSVPPQGLMVRQAIKDLRIDLEDRFSAAILKYTGHPFQIDTILLDVPEPGKDQLTGLLVDRRSKRSLRRSPLLAHFHPIREVDVVELTSISPIASALSHAFSRWARRARIFMNPADLRQLQNLEFEPGDVAFVWEQVLREKFSITPQQITLRLEEPPA